MPTSSTLDALYEVLFGFNVSISQIHDHLNSTHTFNRTRLLSNEVVFQFALQYKQGQN